MKLEVKTAEVKNALAAIEAVMKKVPNDNSPGDSPVAFLRRGDKFSIISIHDTFSSEINLPSMTVIGTDEPDIWAPWDGHSKTLNDNNVVGLSSPTILKDLSGKLGSAAKTLYINIEKDRNRMKVEAGSGKEYMLDIGPARKIVMSYDKITADDLICSANSDEFAWITDTMSSLGKVVKPTATRMAFGCVAFCAFPSKQENMILSGSSDVDGYSFIYETKILSNVDFTALIPKNLAESVAPFVKALGKHDGNVDVRVTIDENNQIANTAVSRLAFVSDLFSLSFVCMFDYFPFTQFHPMAVQARQPYCKYLTTKDEVKKAVERISLFAKGDDAVTELSILDGGTVELVEKQNVSSSDKPARETCSEGSLVSFPDQVPSLGTAVKTNVLKSALSVITTKDIGVVVCEQAAAQQGTPRRLALLADDGFSELTTVLLGLRS